MPPKRSRNSPSVGGKTGIGATCAECRRLKIRCDRKAPCEQCKRRGCASICPEGRLIPAHGSRSNRVIGQVPANIDVVYRKLESFSQRIQELEAALAESHSASNMGGHPLLAQDLVNLTKEEAMTDDSNSASDEAQDNEEMISLAFGSLVKGPRGEFATYLGPSAASAWLLEASHHTAEEQEILPNHVLSPTLANMSQPTEVRAHLIAHLPGTDVLKSMTAAYFHYSLSLFQPLTSTQFLQDCVLVDRNTLSGTRLSLLFVVLALVTQQAPSSGPAVLSPAAYFSFSRTALTLEDNHANPSIELVEAMGLQALFLLYHERMAIPEKAWITLGAASRAAQAMGLHRDCKRWGLSDDIVRRRRRTFYELWTFDILLSACLGRPPSLSKLQVDCEMPFDDASTFGQDTAFYRWKHQLWTGTLLEVVNSALCSTQPPTYSTIVSLDKQLRASPLPDKLSAASDPCRKVELSQYTQPSIRWQEHMVYLLNNYSLLLLHRPFFARALLESPNDVFQHRFLRSVMTVHDSSKAIVRQVKWLTQNEPETLQMLPFWQLAVVCSLVSLGALMIKSPGCSLAINAMQELADSEYIINWERSSESTRQTLTRLYHSAHQAMAAAHGEQLAASLLLPSATQTAKAEPVSQVLPLASVGPVPSSSHLTNSPLHPSPGTLHVPSSPLFRGPTVNSQSHQSRQSSISSSTSHSSHTTRTSHAETLLTTHRPHTPAQAPPIIIPPTTPKIPRNEYESTQWNFNDFVRVHSHSHMAEQGEAITVSPHMYNSSISSASSASAPSSADPHLLFPEYRHARTDYEGDNMMRSPYHTPPPSAYAPITGIPTVGSTTSAQYTSMGNGQGYPEVENVSWDQFMASMGL